MESYKLFDYTELRDPRRFYKNPPGKPIGIIAVAPVGFKDGDYNPLVLFFIVSHYRRKSFNRLLMQANREESLSDYSKSLFESCFRKWK